MLDDVAKAVAAYRAGFPKIVIHWDGDWTPPGKRTAKVVTTRGGMGRGRQLRWYVGGRIYRYLGAPDAAKIALTREWLAG